METLFAGVGGLNEEIQHAQVNEGIDNADNYEAPSFGTELSLGGGGGKVSARGIGRSRLYVGAHHHR
jgi:hypothetical protein